MADNAADEQADKSRCQLLSIRCTRFEIGIVHNPGKYNASGDKSMRYYDNDD